MQGDPDVLVALNDILTAELTGINQYFVHFRMLENWGYKRLAQKKREESIEEMKHADKVIERILYLDGVPNLQRLGPVRVGEEPIEMHKLDLTLEATFDDQELVTVISDPAFWEGQVTATGTHQDGLVTGLGWAERKGLRCERLDEFFAAASAMVRKRVEDVMPLEPSARQLQDLMVRTDGERCLEGLDAVQRVIRSDDLKEGARAFTEKRKPIWSGK